MCRIRTSNIFASNGKNEEELFLIKQQACWNGDYVFMKEQVAKMSNNEKMLLELIGVKEYGKRK